MRRLRGRGGSAGPAHQVNNWSHGEKPLPAAILFSPVGRVLSIRVACGIGGSLLKIIPVVAVQHFEAGGTLLTFDAAKMRPHYEQELAAPAKLAAS